MRVQVAGDNEGILKISELANDPFIDYVGTYTDRRNEKFLEYRFQAQNDEQAMKILRDQTEHWSAVIAPGYSKSIYVSLEVQKA